MAVLTPVQLVYPFTKEQIAPLRVGMSLLISGRIYTGRDRLHRVLVAGLVIPAQVAMLPLFLELKSIGLVDTLAGVLVPSFAGIFSIFLVRQAALSIPDELLDAARIDGASEWTIYRRIVLPLLTPMLVTLAVFTFLGAWNDFLWPLIAITSQNHMTLQLGLSSFVGSHTTNWPVLMAGTVMTQVPMLLIFLVAQRWFVQSFASSGVKG